MSKKKDALRLKLWKARQAAEGHDVSHIYTPEEAAHFFDSKEKKQTPRKPRASKQNEVDGGDGQWKLF